MQISKKTKTRDESPSQEARISELEAENATLQSTIDLLTVAVLEG